MKTMKSCIVSILAALCISAAAADLKEKLDLQSGDVIFYGGDSIESTNLYSHYVQAWFYLSYPELDLKIYHYGRSGSSLVGWGRGFSDTASGGMESLCERYMYPLNPDVFILKMGGNGGQTADQHKASYEYLVSNWINTVPGRKLMMLGQWSAQSLTDNFNMRGKGDKEAEIAASASNCFSADVYDILGPVWIANHDNAIDIQQPGVNPALSGGTRDSIHPGPAGHFVTAWATLQAMGAESLVSKATLDAAGNSTTATSRCTIRNLSLTATGGTFERLDTRLPWAYDTSGRANGNLLATTHKLGDGTLHDWQDYSLTVTGLAEGTYEIKCDGVVIGSASHTRLAAGWNMAGLEQGPVFDQVQEVLGRIRDLQNMHRVTGANLGNPNPGTMDDFIDYTLGYYQQKLHRGKVYYNEMQPLVTAMDKKIAAIHSAARPLTRSYTITRTSTNPGGGTQVAPIKPTGFGFDSAGLPPN